MATTSTPAQRVCIGMPVYNGERTIEPAIRNLLDQTYRDFELVVYDDGSEDATPEIVSNLAKEDSRVILHRADENRGRGFARNKLLSLTSGAILAWQDADDSWHPQKLELQLGFLLPLLTQGTRAIVLSSYEVATQGEPGAPQIKHPPGIIDADHIFSNAYRGYHFQLQAIIGEADLFAGAGGFDEAMNWSEDIDIALKLIQAGVLLIGHSTEEPLATYNHSLRKAKVTVVEDSQTTILERFGEFAQSKGYDLERILSLRNVSYLGQIYLQTDRPQKALDVALRALVSIDPSDPGDMARIGTISRMLQAVFKGGRDLAPPAPQAPTQQRVGVNPNRPGEGRGMPQPRGPAGNGPGAGGGGNRVQGVPGRTMGSGQPGRQQQAGGRMLNRQGTGGPGAARPGGAQPARGGVGGGGARAGGQPGTGAGGGGPQQARTKVMTGKSTPAKSAPAKSGPAKSGPAAKPAQAKAAPAKPPAGKSAPAKPGANAAGPQGGGARSRKPGK